MRVCSCAPLHQIGLLDDQVFMATGEVDLCDLAWMGSHFSSYTHREFILLSILPVLAAALGGKRGALNGWQRRLPRVDRALVDAVPCVGRYCWETSDCVGALTPPGPSRLASAGAAAWAAVGGAAGDVIRTCHLPPATCHLPSPLPSRPFAGTMGGIDGYRAATW